MLTLITPLRGTDPHGQGHYGATRGSRRHKGVDLAAYPGSQLLSPATGRITRLGYPYDPDDTIKGHYRYVEITTPHGYRHRVFYVLPLVDVDDLVNRNDPIGIVQNIQLAYDHRMTPHVHYEIINPQGKHIDPAEVAR